MKKKILIISLVIIIILNFTPISYLLKENYTYSNADGTFTFSEEAGAGYNFEMAERRFNWFLQEHPGKRTLDSKLYRTFTIKPWRIWQLGDFIFQNERFRLPYKYPDSIRTLRK